MGQLPPPDANVVIASEEALTHFRHDGEVQLDVGAYEVDVIRVRVTTIRKRWILGAVSLQMGEIVERKRGAVSFPGRPRTGTRRRSDATFCVQVSREVDPVFGDSLSRWVIILLP